MKEWGKGMFLCQARISLAKKFGGLKIKLYFCSNSSCHASQRCVPRRDFVFYIGYEIRQTTHRTFPTAWLVTAKRTAGDGWRKSLEATSFHQLFQACKLLADYGRARLNQPSVPARQQSWRGNPVVSIRQETTDIGFHLYTGHRNSFAHSHHPTFLSEIWGFLVHGRRAVQRQMYLPELPWKYPKGSKPFQRRFFERAFHQVWYPLIASRMENNGSGFIRDAFQAI